MSKPQNEKPRQPEMVALRNKARALGMPNAEATHLFVSSKYRKDIADDVKEWTRGNRPAG